MTSSCIVSTIAHSQGSPKSASFSCARIHPNKSALMIILERVHIKSRIVKIEQAIEQAAVQEQRLTIGIEQFTAFGWPKYVRNETSGIRRKTAAVDLRLRPAG